MCNTNQHKISTYALKNLISTYVEHKVSKMEIEIDYESKFGDDAIREMDNDPIYQFHLACCQTAEDWMRAVGISTSCNLVMDMIKTEMENKTC